LEGKIHFWWKRDTCVIEATLFGGKKTPVSEQRQFWWKRDTCVGKETLLEEQRHLCRRRNSFLEGAVLAGLQALGIETPENIKHLGLQLGQDIERTVTETMIKIDPKALKRRILATTPPTDLLHRALLIKTALIPIYNMCSCPYQHLKSRVTCCTRSCSTSYGHGKLTETLYVNGDWCQKAGSQRAMIKEACKFNTLRNLIQRIYQEGMNNQRHSKLPELLQDLLRRINRPTLDEHVRQLGPS
jgi:hypothetical protein